GLNITGGNFRIGNLKNAFEVDSIDQDKVTVSGGYFTSDPSDYLAENYHAVASDKDGYAYMVTAEQPTEAPVIVTENVDAVIDSNAEMTEDAKKAIKDVIKNAAVSGVADALTNTAKDNIVDGANISDEILND